MNVAEILRKCPLGTKLYSPVYGEVELAKVDDDEDYPITCITENGVYRIFTSDGMISCDYSDAECMLFPSKAQRDWSKFGVSDQVTDQETKPQFKPFEQVLVRDDDDEKWGPAFFSVLDSSRVDPFGVMGNEWPVFYNQCIPYNDDTKHLLYTSDPYKPKAQ